jgi:NAD(P)H-hydrate epimerase
VPCLLFDQDGDLAELRRLTQGAAIIVDALLGTGVSRPIEGSLRDLMVTVRDILAQRRRTSAAPLVVAVDLPSGLHTDSGACDQVTFPADLTVTFAFPKRGFYLFPAANFLGELVVADIGIDPVLAEDVRLEICTDNFIASLLPARPRDAHKGIFGRLLIVAGCRFYTGAPALAALGAGRVGTGLVTLAIPASIQSIVASHLTEATYLPLPDHEGALTVSAIDDIVHALPGYDAMLIGPGLGRSPETVAFVHALLCSLATTAIPLVLDADGLNAVAADEAWPERVPALSILTPHPGEMARLCGGALPSGDRIALAEEKAQAWNKVVILKGAYTVVAVPASPTRLIPFANPALATAGSGDVLAGAVAGFLAQGLPPAIAATCGAYVHGYAGELARQQRGDAGVLAGDLPGLLPMALRAIKESSR